MKRLLFSLLLSAPALALPPVIGEDILVDAKAGDSVYELARTANLALEHVAFANDLPIQLELEKEQRLRIPLRRILPREHPQNGIVVNLPERGGYIFKGGQFAGFFPVAIGKKGYETPTGTFKIVNLVENPTWIPPEWAKEEKPVPPGPKNPLGDRWIGLSEPGLGLHATNAPDSVGGDVSHGCMRTYPKLAHQIFPHLNKQMEVKIVYEPVKFGRDEEGRLNVQVFPDVYNHNRSGQKARAILAEEGLEMPMGLLNSLIKQDDGLAKVVLDTPSES
jgi:L,D-transpeptidase ErfK/SrfK